MPFHRRVAENAVAELVVPRERTVDRAVASEIDCRVRRETAIKKRENDGKDQASQDLGRENKVETRLLTACTANNDRRRAWVAQENLIASYGGVPESFFSINFFNSGRYFAIPQESGISRWQPSYYKSSLEQSER